MLGIAHKLKQQSDGWASKDQMSLGISVLALALSGLSFYVQFFWEAPRLSSAVKLDLRAAIDLERGELQPISISLVNPGNQPVLVEELYISTSQSKDFHLDCPRAHYPTFSWQRLHNGDTSRPAEPIVIKPGDVVSSKVDFEIPGSEVRIGEQFTLVCLNVSYIASGAPADMGRFWAFEILPKLTTETDVQNLGSQIKGKYDVIRDEELHPLIVVDRGLHIVL
jgi:hypothetical protein